MRGLSVVVGFLAAASLEGCVDGAPTEEGTGELAGGWTADEREGALLIAPGDELVTGDDEALLADEDEAAAADPAEVAALAGCTLQAYQPYWSSGYLFGSGSWSGCPANASITVVLRQDIAWWPDRTLASGKKTGAGGTIGLSYPCGTDYDPIKVFIETRYGSRKVQSARAIVPCG
jgi:hypothetical protein